MKCLNHPEKDALAMCVSCGVGLCSDCRKESANKDANGNLTITSVIKSLLDFRSSLPTRRIPMSPSCQRSRGVFRPSLLTSRIPAMSGRTQTLRGSRWQWLQSWALHRSMTSQVFVVIRPAPAGLNPTNRLSRPTPREYAGLRPLWMEPGSDSVPACLDHIVGKWRRSKLQPSAW